ncbi:uncharacterized protein ARMOST_17793 [Armillaria ostoyae]|uniref:Uncharacterized protein n=1 Tax=Armillaria ostoyae TaxID=47428 RepID=A0A284S031_ARMOS|nr:uncharacterized protein ARMOST_17793 [Armillaria ostoyae]
MLRYRWMGPEKSESSTPIFSMKDWKDITSHEWVAAIASVERWAAVQLYMGYVKAGVLNSEHDVEDFKSYRVDAIGYQDSVPRVDLGDQTFPTTDHQCIIDDFFYSAWDLESGQSDIEERFGRNARIRHRAGGGRNGRDIPVSTSHEEGGMLIIHSDIAVVQYVMSSPPGCMTLSGQEPFDMNPYASKEQSQGS